MNRAQRAAVGPAGGKPLVKPLDFTQAQEATHTKLKQDFGAKWVGTPRHVKGTHNMAVPMSNAVAKATWIFGPDGNYLTRYTQRALFDDTDTDNTA